MKILFVNPSCLDPRVTDPDALQVPIGLYYLAAGLLDQGWSSGILNLAPAGPANPSANGSAKKALDLFTQSIMQEQPDIIGFSLTSPTRINAMACADRARQILPDSLIVFGGPGATFMADFLFSGNQEFMRLEAYMARIDGRTPPATLGDAREDVIERITLKGGQIGVV
ncbi:MAG: cobalamin-dependent protein, partial [Desulfobacterales bacterium]|nr:cobalamin-dependent protein [Desulfobacterales bacterium]